jgi:hypothetical protein
MATFAYKKVTNTTLKACGILDTDNGTINVDDVEKSITTLLSDFNGAYVDLIVKTKDEEELNEPVNDEG